MQTTCPCDEEMTLNELRAEVSKFSGSRVSFLRLVIRFRKSFAALTRSITIDSMFRYKKMFARCSMSMKSVFYTSVLRDHI